MNYSAPFPGWEWKFGLKMITKQHVNIEALMDRTLPFTQAMRLPSILSEFRVSKRKIVLDCSA